jgi:two-component system, OmpR family, sensor histidine kinase KdpD
MERDERPDPDQLLADLNEEVAAKQRGKLTLFFGASAGVGKTYAMLEAAHAAQREGRSVWVGVVETHGRSDTQRLIAGLRVLPKRSTVVGGRTRSEFDLDGAIAAQPDLLVVDELAHSNAPGSRHAKRWQDVEELLAMGIDVFTALNVQHLESLNDVVAGITGIKVLETVPDPIFDAADEVRLVDLPADVLLARLAAGKVYLGDAAERAGQNFFRKGNLIALRELALRRTADRVDAQMRDWRMRQSRTETPSVWETRERIMVAIAGRTTDERLIREGARLAAQLQCEWMVVEVERPSQNGRPRDLGDGLPRLVEALGGQTFAIPGMDVATALAEHARRHNATRVVMGHSSQPWWVLSGPLHERLIRIAPEIDVILIATQRVPRPVQFRHWLTPDPNLISRLGWASLGMILVSAMCAWLLAHHDLANVVMVYLLAVVLISAALGRGAGVLAAAMAVVSFNFFFIPPRFTFAVDNPQYLITFFILFAVALLTGQLTARLKEQVRRATEREVRASALAAMSGELSGAIHVEQIAEIAERHLAPPLTTPVEVITLGADGHLQFPETGVKDAAAAQWAFDNQRQAGAGTATLSACPARYVPLKAPMRVRGVLELVDFKPAVLDTPDSRRFLDAATGHVAMALERIHYLDVAQNALITMEGERMRNTLLAAISHDLRTPLTVLIGTAAAMERCDDVPHLQRDAQRLRQEAEALNALVTNLLDMARLQANGVAVKREWHSLQEIVGSALARLATPLASFQVVVDVDTQLPLVWVDATLLERVLVNVLDNAAKYGVAQSPAAARLDIKATVEPATDDWNVSVSVRDYGPGIPADAVETLFQPFRRGHTEGHITGVGLGLALAERIMQAHGGSITASNVAPDGAEFVIQFFTPKPPPVEIDETGEAGSLS